MEVPKFNLGKILLTSKARAFLSRSQVQDYLKRHSSGDWGKGDARENESALISQGQLISIFEYFGQDIWVVTDSRRQATCIMFPEEY